ncbi:MAG: DUF975 family protein [Lachnospiraceae bacterium]|nr:DUF975 family protein [Lachnospiraceae bacterium]
MDTMEKATLNRKALKKAARARFFKFYWMFVFLCLLLAALGISYGSTISALTSDIRSEESVSFYDFTTKLVSSLRDAAKSDDDTNSEVIDDTSIETPAQKEELNITDNQKMFGIISVGYSRGVFASVYNSVSSGDMFSKLFTMIHEFAKSPRLATALFIFFGLAFSATFSICLLNVFMVSVKRVFMEARTYDIIPSARYFYLYKTRTAFKVGFAVFVRDVLEFLWILTIVGGAIKAYSYMMVPYILAENPSLKPLQAIKLSRKMMHGHKIEAFKLSVSFLPYALLDVLTFGLVGILYANPYMEITRAEYYAYVRRCAKRDNVEGVEVLNDLYLYEYAPEKKIRIAYADILQTVNEVSKSELPKNIGFRGFMEDTFGLTPAYDAKEKAYQDISNKKYAIKHIKEALEQKTYPFRMFTIPIKEGARDVGPTHYDRHYSFFSIVFMFFSMSMVGWLWEVVLHMLQGGGFVNRGTLHGPWLPIYGCGGILILLVLNKLRKKPVAEFFAAIILCGVLEYFISWFLEVTYGGMKWWDYTGYFLNINGRICGEGLLVFGLGGVAFVYAAAPALDNIFRGIRKNIAVPVCVALLIVFFLDVGYSSMHPNAGKGITAATHEISTVPEANGGGPC